VSAHAPPKRESRPGRAALENLQRDSSQDFHVTQPFGWQREAARLFGEYWRTGRPADIEAFARHVIGMRTRLIERVKEAITPEKAQKQLAKLFRCFPQISPEGPAKHQSETDWRRTGTETNRKPKLHETET